MSKAKTIVEAVADMGEYLRLDGFDRGLNPLKILDAVIVDGEIVFLMEWENCENNDLVFAKEAHVRCPLVVIQFYEECIEWKNEIDGVPDPAEYAGGLGFRNGLQPYKILGALGLGDDLVYLMQWRNSEIPDYVFAKDANARCPHIVIQFHERQWQNAISTLS